MGAGEDAPRGQFDDEIEFLGWLILRGGLPAREFAEMPPGDTRTLLMAGIKRAEQIRQRELMQLAEVMGGGASGT